MSFVTNSRGDNFYTPDAKIRVKDEPAFDDEEFGDHNHLDYFLENDGGLRKSLSMSDVTALREDLMSLGLRNDREDVYHRYSRAPQSASHELSKTKFVSMAEAIYHYQKDTPGRFHTTKPQKFQPQARKEPSGLTIPQSPMLRCKARSRPLHVMSQKEKEELEIEEMKKFKLKASGIPKSVISGSRNLPDVKKKPPTVPEPFKLTEMPNKNITMTPEPVPVFKAKPAPVKILREPQVPPKPPVQITIPVTPKLHSKKAKSVDHLKQKSVEKPKTADGHLRLGPIKPIPFSFEKRDEEFKKKHDEWIKQQIEEQRKPASGFKAQPLPEAIKKRMCSATTKSSSSTTSENKENFTKFEAKPPVVLYKEPFKPVLQQVDIIKTKPFNLNTMKRAAERERFDQQLKEKEKEMERIKEQKEKEHLEAEEQKIVELRTKLVHHAKPVPSAVRKPFVPEKAEIPLTIPQTPTFVRKLKQQH